MKLLIVLSYKIEPIILDAQIDELIRRVGIERFQLEHLGQHWVVYQLWVESEELTGQLLSALALEDVNTVLLDDVLTFDFGFISGVLGEKG